VAKGSNPTTGLTLLWARNPFRGNFNHWQVSGKEAGQKNVFFLFICMQMLISKFKQIHNILYEHIFKNILCRTHPRYNVLMLCQKNVQLLQTKSEFFKKVEVKFQQDGWPYLWQVTGSKWYTFLKYF
jgi:hypothetical protein